jgi:hypothetical protein
MNGNQQNASLSSVIHESAGHLRRTRVQVRVSEQQGRAQAN